MFRTCLVGLIALTACMLISPTRLLARDDDDAKAAYYKKMTASAKANAEAMMKDLTVEEGFDPADPAAFKGKLIKIETDNLMGWRFKPGDFPFATTLDGMPIAGKYDATVKKAIEQIEEKLARSLGDSDDDGKWTIIARVEGRKGQLQRKVKVEGTVDGAQVNGERVETVEAPIITIVAAHCGPLAVAKDKGMAKEDGSVGAP